MKPGSEDSKTGCWTSTRAYKQVAKAKLDLNKTRVFLAVAKGLKYMEGHTKGCWGRPPTLGRVLSGLNLIHGPLGQNKMMQHHGQKICRYKTDDCGRLRNDMDVRSDPLESRLDKLSTKYLNGPI